MKILIINPNSDDKMTKKIQESAERFVAGEYIVKTITTATAPEFMSGYKDDIIAAPEMIKTIEENQGQFDAFIIACHGDPNLDVLKEISEKPVVGIAEASFKIASILGHSFSVISPVEKIIPGKKELVRKYHLQEQLASVRIPKNEGDLETSLLNASQKALQEDLAEVIILGCADYSGYDIRIKEKLGVPVLDGVICALIIASGLVKYNISTSKIRKYS